MKYDGVFPENPKWELDRAGSRTIGVALADFDGDGDLDLAAGNAGAPNTIRWNDGEPLFSEVWTSEDNASTVTVVAGDVDGDGNLDLVCGNGGESNQKNTLYLNTDGRFTGAEAITWEEATGNATIGVALGDVDGDGDLDLVCGNNNAQSNTLYLNDGSNGVFNATPAWSSNFKRDTFGVALGDVDGDGDLDLVCGNAGTADQANTLYLNEGGKLSLTPDWESELTGRTTFGVALGDIDGDGDLDLACGNGGTATEKNTLYLNVGGPDYFTGQPVWESDTADKTFGVAAGHVENDGDVDLMFANAGTAGQSNMLYLGRKDPVFKGVPEFPEHSTPNNAAHLVNLRVSPQIGEGDTINVSFVAVDADSDPVWVVPEYQYEGEGCQGWKSLRDARNAGLVGLLNTSPDGVEHSFEWDTFLLTFDPRPVVLRLRVVEVPQTVSVMQHIASYVKPIGPITPARPEIKVSPRIVEFPTVCQCGDTSAVVTIANTGTKALQVDSLVFQPELDQTSAMAIDRDFPINVEPGSKVDVEILFKPHPNRVIPQNVVVFSNDLITPQDTVEIHTNVISLTSTRIPDDEKVDSNQDVDIYILSVPDGTSYVAGYLDYRLGGKTVWDNDSLPLEGVPPTATIPGDDVGSRGVQYRVTVNVALDDTTLTLTDPPCDPFISLPVKVGGLQFPYGLPHDRYRMISIPLDLEDGTIVGAFDELGSPDPKNWRLWGYYDKHVDHYYRELPKYKKSFEQGRGYWLVTRNGGLRLNTSPDVGFTAPTDTAFVKQIYNSWNMIGNPFHFNVAWDLVRVGVVADSLTTEEVLTMEEALQRGYIERPRRWLHEQRAYNNSPVRVLVPFDGYFVKGHVDSGEVLTLYIPPDEAPTEAARVAPTDHKAADDTDASGEWTVRIGASSARVTDPYNYIGVKEGARSVWDPNDLSEPPSPPCGALSLYFPHNGWDDHAGCYTTDFRGDYQAIGAQTAGVASFGDDASGHAWSFDVATNLSSNASGDPVHLEFSGIDQVPDGAEVILADRHLNKVIDLREQSYYDFNQANEPFIRDDDDARFVVLVGGENFVDPETQDLRKIPTKTILRTNYPNPFNPITIVRYELARPVRVTLRIYDVNGKLVKVLVDRNREAGYYEVGWNATNERGGPVSSGVYFYRFEADGVVQTRKMVFLK
jgi:hypothetical protein